jgi:hypothetical protein
LIAAQFVEGASQFPGWVIFVAAVDLALHVFDQQAVSPGFRICESFSAGIVDANCQLLRPMGS